jgi:hypothetical protein
VTDPNPERFRHELRTATACGSRPGQARQVTDPRISQELPPVTGDPIPRAMPSEPSGPHDPSPEVVPAESPAQPTGDSMYLL